MMMRMLVVVVVMCHLNAQAALTMVDELCDLSPKLEKDSFFDGVDVDIAYNDTWAKHRARHYRGSAVESMETRAVHKNWYKKRQHKYNPHPQ